MHRKVIQSEGGGVFYAPSPQLKNYMKRILTFILLQTSIFSYSQAHIGVTYEELERLVDYKPMKTGYLQPGYWYAECDHQYGRFVYCFNNEGVTVGVFMIPWNQGAVNAQAEIYNQRYTIISETSWKAYLSGGGIMSINLKYDEDYGQYIFTYQ